VKKTRRRRIRGGGKTAADADRAIYARQRRVAAMKADDEAAKKREVEAAAVQQAAQVQGMMKKERANNDWSMKQKWLAEDAAREVAEEKGDYSGWVVGQSFPAQTADFKQALHIINRNNAGFKIIYAFYLGSISLLENRDTTPVEIKALITKLVDDIKTYINQHDFLDSPAQLAKQYYLGVDANKIDENYFERISILHGGGMGLGKNGGYILSIIQDAGINLGRLLELLKVLESKSADDAMDVESDDDL
jgi:hypothetical protein